MCEQTTHFFSSFRSINRSAIARQPVLTLTPSRKFQSNMMKFFSRYSLTSYNTSYNTEHRHKFRILFFSIHIALVALVYQPKNITEISRLLFNNQLFNFLFLVAKRVFKSTPGDHNVDRHTSLFLLSLSLFVESFDATIPDITESQKFPE